MQGWLFLSHLGGRLVLVLRVFPEDKHRVLLALDDQLPPGTGSRLLRNLEGTGMPRLVPRHEHFLVPVLLGL